MEQWLYALVVIVVLVAGWRYLVRPWVERHARPVDERRLGDRGQAAQARERRNHDKWDAGGIG